MNKILKLTSVSMLAIVTATGARAAGYTCEELVEYESCNPGYYYGSEVSGTGMVCPDWLTDAKIYNDGICWNNDGYLMEDDTQETCEAYDYEIDGIDAYWVDGPVCVGSSEDMGDINYTTELEEGDVYTDTCVLCPVGSICAGGDVEDAVIEPCPAGSYCATKGLSAVSGVCAVGSYSTGGATACTTCPSSDLTDANGNVVSVTTASTGATSSSACYVAKGTEFKDNRGTYRYNDNCTHGNFDRIGDVFYESTDGTCVNGYEYMKAYEGSNGWYDDDMVISDTGCYKIPDNEEWCHEVNGTWDGNSCECVGFEWFGDAEHGIYNCDMS